MVRSRSFCAVAAVMIAASSGADPVQVGGWVRAGYQHQVQDDLAASAHLFLRSERIYGLYVGATLSGVEGLGARDNVGVPFFGSHAQGYALLSEAYLGGKWERIQMKIGRQELDIPYADSDDIGMLPNRFEGVTLTARALADTTLMIGQIGRWAGVDAPVAERFTPVAGHPMRFAGIIYEGIEGLNLQAWYDHITDTIDLSYLEARYEGEREGYGYSFAAQYTLQDRDKEGEAKIYGVEGSLRSIALGVEGRLAYNRCRSVEGVGAENMYGGGPFFTSSEHLTIADGGADAKSFSFGIAWEGAQGWSFSCNRFRMRSDSSDATEDDVTVRYAPAERLSLDLVHSIASDRKVTEQNFHNTRFFVNYRF